MLNFDGANTIIDEWIKYAGGINAAAEGMIGNLQTISRAYSNPKGVFTWDRYGVESAL